MNAAQGELDGLAALVTGASSGIGEATALELAARGASVTLAARRVDRLTTLAGKIDSGGGRALALATDVTDQAQAVAAVERTVEAFGRLDIVINNAGVMLLGPALDAPAGDWDRMVALNVQAALYVAHAALPHLVKAAGSEPRQVADLINVSSISGRQASAGAAVYSLTKHGLGAFSESLRQELSARHVRVGLVEPGPVDTELITHLSPAALKAAQQSQANTESLTAKDVADTITYMVTRPRHVALNEVLVRPTESAF